jgi:hypothetical protein
MGACHVEVHSSGSANVGGGVAIKGSGGLVATRVYRRMVNGVWVGNFKI